MKSNKKRYIPLWTIIVLFFSKPEAMLLIFIFLGLPTAYFGYGPDKNTANDDSITTCVITDIEPAGVQIGFKDGYRYYYKFTTNSGEFVESSDVRVEGMAEVGDELTVQYDPDNPNVSNFTEIKRFNVLWVFILGLLFVLVGVIFVILTLSEAISQFFIMKNGQIVDGKLIKREETGTMVNDKAVYKMFFEFTATNGKKYVINTKTHHTNKLSDDEKEAIIFDERNPGNAFPIDILPRVIMRYLKR